MNWIRIALLPLVLSASLSWATDPSQYTPIQLNNPVVTWNNLKISEYSVALYSEPSDVGAAKEKKEKSKRDCDALVYEVTLFNPCPGENRKRLWQQTKVVFVGGFAVMGFILLLPEDISKWDKSEIGKGDLIEKWWENVKAGPVWDTDKWYINWIGHPYFGGVYYQGARKSGYNQWNSMVYSALMSTFYWEYGVEAFAEVPSIQDLVITPLGGWIYGEWAHHKEQEIRARGGTALGSKTWGSISLFLLDPLGAIDTWVRKKSNRKIQEAVFHLAHSPVVPVGNGVVIKYDHWEVKLALKF